jgi:hypothetical protein
MKIARRVYVSVLVLLFLATLAAPWARAEEAGPKDLPGMGLIPSQGDLPAYEQPLGAELHTLPSSVDLSAGLPPVGDQGAQNSCVGWTLGYYIKSYLEGQEQGWSLDGPTHQFSPAWVYNQRSAQLDATARGECAADGGMTMYDGLRILQNRGAATLDDLPYSVSDPCSQPSSAVAQAAEPYRIADYGVIFSGQQNADIQVLKSVLANGEVIAIAVPIYRSFYYVTASDPVVPVPSPGESMYGGHAMTVVGYDDSVGGFLTANSWGADWGLNGYCYLSYDFVADYAWEAWAVVDAEGPTTTPDNTTTMQVSLAQGWNLVGIPLDPDNSSLAGLVAGVAEDVEVAYGWDASAQTWRRYDPTGPAYATSLSHVSVGQGLWIKMRQAREIQVMGTMPETWSIPLDAGWNLVAFPSGVAANIEDVTASIAGYVTEIHAYRNESDTAFWQHYVPDAPLGSNTLAQLEPQRGYWIHVTHDCTWYLP